MGKEHIDDYFMSFRRTEFGPVMLGVVQGSQSDLYRLCVTDRMGAKVTDFEDFDLERAKREAGSLANSLKSKGYIAEVCI